MVIVPLVNREGLSVNDYKCKGDLFNGPNQVSQPQLLQVSRHYHSQNRGYPGITPQNIRYRSIASGCSIRTYLHF